MVTYDDSKRATNLLKHDKRETQNYLSAASSAALAAAPDVPVDDADNPPTDGTDWDRAIVSRSLPELRQQLAERRGRGPQKKPLKVPTTIRFDADVLAALKATGKGWQTRVNDAMREWVDAQGRGME